MAESQRLLENEIRPETLKSEQTAAIEKDRQFLYGHQSSFRRVDCPACDLPNESHFAKDGFFYSKCSKCNMIYMSPRPTETILQEFYAQSANYQYFNQYIFPASAEARRQKIFIPRVNRTIELCEIHGAGRNHLLEVGAGFGLFCEEMHKRSFFERISAVEATQALSGTLARKKIEVFNDLFERIVFENQFDVVVAFEVIEHITNPFRHLKKAHDVLKDKGLLILSFPNCDGFDIATLGKSSDSIDHEHLNYFNSVSITRLLNKAGFSIASIETPGKLDVELVRKKILCGQYRPNNFIRSLCIHRFDELGETFQQFLSAHNLSSHMVVAAIKEC